MERTSSKSTVLIVDDEQTTIEVLAKILGSEYRILFATQPDHAIELAQSKCPDLILMDVLMPGMDGYAVCNKLKELNSTKDIPIIFVTAMGEEQFEETGFIAGGVDYVTKPIRPFVLRSRVKTHIDLKVKGDMLREIALTDGLTGIPNRRNLDEFLQAEWKRSIRQGASCLSALLIDVDYFKRFNDHYGHQAGDQCLVQIARTIMTSLERDTDLAARYGGEEFACILPVTPVNGAVNLAKRIQNNVEKLRIEHDFSDVKKIVTLSIGVATVIPNSNETPRLLLTMADKLLYEAKLN
ncbi:MAG: diguanylate cyclase, partial [Magnetococcales bacterium]|nr:diguanylate cyclase [Magnetococcales bacterium]